MAKSHRNCAAPIGHPGKTGALTHVERQRERERERAAEELKARIRDNPIVGEHVDWCDFDLGGVNVFFFVTSTAWRWCYGIMVASSELSEWWA